VVWYPYAGFSLHKDTTPPQPNLTVTPTHIEPEQYNHEITQHISRNLLRMDVLTCETCWAVNNEVIKQVTSSWSIFIQPPGTAYLSVCQLLRKDPTACSYPTTWYVSRIIILQLPSPPPISISSLLISPRPSSTRTLICKLMIWKLKTSLLSISGCAVFNTTVMSN